MPEKMVLGLQAQTMQAPTTFILRKVNSDLGKYPTISDCTICVCECSAFITWCFVYKVINIYRPAWIFQKWTFSI